MTNNNIEITSTFLVHAGLPKCASTSLQKFLKEDHNFSYLGKWKEGGSGAHFVDKELKAFVEDDVYTLNDKEFYQNYTKGIFSHLLNPDKVNVLSEEALSGIGFRHGLTCDISLLSIVSRIKHVFDHDFDLLIVTRDYDDFIYSYYKQKVVGNYYQSFKYFLENESTIIQRMKSLLHSEYKKEIEEVISGKYFDIDFKQLISGGTRLNGIPLKLDLENPSRSRLTILKKRFKNFKKSFSRG